MVDEHTKDILDDTSRSFPLEDARKRPLLLLTVQKGAVFATAVREGAGSGLIRALEGSPIGFSIVRRQKRETAVADRYTHRVCQVETEGQIEVLKGFWEYLKGSLIGRGGIRYGRLPLYLAEYAWKYNHRNLSKDRRIKLLLNLLGG
jgi:hypothetical protein